MLSQYVQKTCQACKVRNAGQAETVWGKLEFAQDLHAADVVYQASVQCQLSAGKTDSKEAW